MEQREGAVQGLWPVGSRQGGRLPIGDAQVKGGGEQRQKYRRERKSGEG